MIYTETCLCWLLVVATCRVSPQGPRLSRVKNQQETGTKLGSECTYCFLRGFVFCLEEGGITCFRNVGEITEYAASQHRLS
jgi:hypothetical protein